MGLPPCPGPAPILAHRGGPPDDPVPLSCRLQVRPRENPNEPGEGPWRTVEFPTEPLRAEFVSLWQHDFEMSLQ